MWNVRNVWLTLKFFCSLNASCCYGNTPRQFHLKTSTKEICRLHFHVTFPLLYIFLLNLCFIAPSCLWYTKLNAVAYLCDYFCSKLLHIQFSEQSAVNTIWDLPTRQFPLILLLQLKWILDTYLLCMWTILNWITTS